MIIKTKVKFEAAHRLLKDAGKCFNLHGHNFQVEIEIHGKINSQGYVIDFKQIKAIFDPLDHATILEKNDPLIIPLTELNQKLYILDMSPSCENLSKHIVNLILNESKDIEYCYVILFENGDSCAIASDVLY